MPQTLTYPLTSLVEIQNIWSEVGVNLRLDDLVSNVDTVLEIVGEATIEVRMYLDQWYNAEVLYGSVWVRRQASWIAAYLLSRRRGDPGNYYDQYQSILEKLEKIRNGYLQIPDLPTRADASPGHSNLRVDDRFAVNKIRVQSSTSTGGVSGTNQHLDYFPTWEYY